jgi:DNA mismatch repair protein MutL
MPSRIKLLPENLINRIAAGEVVERPASILKELLENSLDAGASRIEIQIEAGGKKLIRVTDDGCGMNKEELFLCLERHATSKLGPESDLMAIGTLGFRGEALPSIASVSKLTITSRPADEPDGHKAIIEGGRLLGIEPAPANPGTISEVRDIFFNVPARRKFLKTDATEEAHIQEAAERYALSRSGLSLKLFSGQREILSVDGQNDFQARAARIMGRETALSLRPFQYQEKDLSIHGWLGGPETAGRSNSALFLYVLGRPVRDRLLSRAVTQGYGRILPSGRWPSGIVFLDIDPARVDVNVHPAKIEVRFREPGYVFEALSGAVSKTVSPSQMVSLPAQPPTGPMVDLPEPLPRSADNVPRHYQDSRALKNTWDHMPDGGDSSLRPEWYQAPNASTLPETEAGNSGQGLKGAPSKAAAPSPDVPDLPPWMLEESGPGPGQAEPEGSLPQANRDSIRIMGQLGQCYILAQCQEGLFIIDQHAAHERIVFNRLKEELARDGLSSQRQLFPETFELSPHQALAAQELKEPLRHIGFELEPFGGSTWVLKGIPSLLDQKAASQAILDILSAAQGSLRSLGGGGMASQVDEISDSWLHTMACRAALKAGHSLTQAEMAYLLKDLREAQSGGYCPHGRPAAILISFKELEKRFGRI